MEKVLEIFRQINQIPRASHHEEKMADWLCQFAQARGLDYSRDKENCVVIRQGATAGYEHAEPIVLLNHMDMVAVGDGSRPFDPFTDPIETYIQDGWMHAKGTSLGADNGIGLSMALAVLDDPTIAHGPIEVLTTTNEEDGMSGAAQLSNTMIKGRRVVNLDSEDYDTITVGAAGAYIQTITMPTRPRKADNAEGLQITLKGGQGGHSGVDINKGRVNAIKALVDVLVDTPHLTLVSIDGGEASASIASSCTAIVSVENEYSEQVATAIQTKLEQLTTRYADKEPQLYFSISYVALPEYTIANGQDILHLISQLPCGVITMREDMPDTVMSSNNIGKICTSDQCIQFSCHTRSFADQEMVNIATRIAEQAHHVGGKTEVVMNTPGWQENTQSAWIRQVEDTFEQVLGFRPREVAMHFVLEAGYYVQKYPGIEIACIGPRIVEPHSPKERVEMRTIEDIWKVLVAILATGEEEGRINQAEGVFVRGH